MISSYLKEYNQYIIPQLYDAVYLIKKNVAVNPIQIDNGEAYISQILTFEQYAIRGFKATNITLEESESLDERYRFTHNISFTLDGYYNYDDISGEYYVIIGTKNDEYWCLNPQIAAKLSYTYTLGTNRDETVVTLGTVSNHPLLHVVNFRYDMEYICPKYKYESLRALRMNDARYCLRDGDSVMSTNDGFKDVYFIKDSLTFTEQFDGDYISDTIEFNIGFTNYKPSWHYNLLEFLDNTYSAILMSTSGKYMLCGFGRGLIPSYTINGSSNESTNSITITLTNRYDDPSHSFVLTDVDANETTTNYHYNYTEEYAECVDQGRARYLLKKEIDSTSHFSGCYQCLKGYEDYFKSIGLCIKGTFNETEEFGSNVCSEEGCYEYDNFPSEIKFALPSEQTFRFRANGYWRFVSSNSFITISPNAGMTEDPYEWQDITIKSSIMPNKTVEEKITLEYCGTKKEIKVLLLGSDDGGPSGGYNFSRWVDTDEEECVECSLGNDKYALQFFDDSGELVRYVKCNALSTKGMLESKHTGTNNSDYRKAENIIIGNCVTVIGDRTFHNSPTVAQNNSFTLPNSLKEIMDYGLGLSSYITVDELILPNSIEKLGDGSIGGSAATIRHLILDFNDVKEFDYYSVFGSAKIENIYVKDELFDEFNEKYGNIRLRGNSQYIRDILKPLSQYGRL